MALKNCYLKSLNFELNKVAPNIKFEINPRLKSEVKVPQTPNGEVIISLTLEIDNMVKPTPFNLKLEAEGVFSDEKFTKNGAEAATRGTSDLFIYVRGIIATLTANANIPSYLLPLIDFDKQPKDGEVEVEKGN